MTYEWTIDDETMYGESVTHTFDETGPHVIVVHASNARSSQTINDTLRVINHITQVRTKLKKRNSQ